MSQKKPRNHTDLLLCRGDVLDREDTDMVKLPIVAADQLELFVEKGKGSVRPTQK